MVVTRGKRIVIFGQEKLLSTEEKGRRKEEGKTKKRKWKSAAVERFFVIVHPSHLENKSYSAFGFDFLSHKLPNPACKD